jgi:hypothetical protein
MDVVTLALQEELQRDQGFFVGHETRQQQHRMAVAARRLHQQRQRSRQQRHFEQGARLQQRGQGMRRPDVGMADNGTAIGHGVSVYRFRSNLLGRSP